MIAKKKSQDYFFIISLILLAIWAYHWICPAEDAVILFNYSKNLSERGLITYSLYDTQPIEGATDFLWMILIAIGSLFKCEPYFVALVINILSVCAMWFVYRRLGFSCFFILFVFFVMPYGYAGLLGFSVMFFSLIYLLAMVRVKTDDVRFFYVLLLLLSLTRPDGIVWGLGLYSYRLFYFRQNIRLEFKSSCLYWVIPFLLYWGIRAIYFHEFWPLPFIVKALDNQQPYLIYPFSVLCVLLVIQPVFFSLFFYQDKRQLCLDACLFFIWPCVFYALIRLEQNIGNRFLAPMFFGWLGYLGQQKRFNRLGECVFLIASMFYASWLTQYIIRTIYHSRSMNIYYIAKALSPFRGRILTSEAGRLTFYSRWQVHDSWGLNTPYFAHHFLNQDDIEKGGYDLITTHSDLSYFDVKPGEQGLLNKNWDNQGKVILSYLKNHQNYDIYLIPYFYGPYFHDQCRRYDVYGLSKSFKNYDAVKKILLKYGGISYSSDLIIDRDKICRL